MNFAWLFNLQIFLLLVNAAITRLISNADSSFDENSDPNSTAADLDTKNHKNRTSLSEIHEIDRFAFYFSSCDRMLDGEWKFVTNSENTTSPFLGKFEHKSGRMFASIVWKRTSNNRNIMYVDAELYDGAFRETTARFQLRFVQDFKNYADNFLNMENSYSNIDIKIYQYFHQLSSTRYYVKSNFSKYFVDDKSIIQIMGNQKGLDGNIIIDLNPIYLGSISSLDIFRCQILKTN